MTTDGRPPGRPSPGPSRKGRGADAAPPPLAGGGRGERGHTRIPTALVRRRALLALPLATPAIAQPCTRILVADLRLRLVEGYPLVTAAIAGRPVSLLLDTGAQGMLITPEAAQSLGLPLAGMTTVFGTGGSQPARVVSLPGLRLGGADMPGQLAPVAALPAQLQADPPLAGLLGASVLARFDLEIDVPASRIRLWSPSPCPPGVPGPALAMEVTRAGEPFIAVQVNGQPLLALLDTGSRATLLTEATARRVGLVAPPSANMGAGLDGSRMQLAHGRVRMQLGPHAMNAAPVSVAPLQLERGDMLLGLDQLRQQPVWLGYAAGVAVLGPR